jgi:regulator of sigma E protease
MFLLSLITNLAFIALSVAGLSFVVGFHELGHFLFCKIFKIRTPSFSIGFGPKLISKQIGETEFSISAIPLGGYVEIAGAVEVGQGEQKDAYSTDQYSFAIKPYYQKLAVMIGGIVFNILFAYITLILICASGLPQTPMLYPYNARPTIETVAENSAALNAGMRAGDQILSANGIAIENNGHGTKQLISLIQQHPEKPITFEIQRNDSTISITGIPDKRSAGWPLGTLGTLGVVFTAHETQPESLGNALINGIRITNALIKNTAFGILSLFSKRDINGVSGPLMIISMASKGAAAGMKIFFILLALISISLAIFNLLPLPIFDGGQILFYSIEALIGRPLPGRVREYIHYASWIMILLLMCYVSIADIRTIASPYVENVLQFFGVNK